MTDGAAEHDDEGVATTASALLARYGHDPLVIKAARLLTAGRDELDHRAEDLTSLATVLEREGRRYRELFDKAPDPYLVTDRMGVVLEANQRAKDLFGRGVRARRPLVLCLASGDSDRFYRLLLKVGSGGPFREILSYETPGGPRTFETSCTALGPDRCLWLLRDFTDVENARTRLATVAEGDRLLAEQLGDLSELRGASLLAISHDLRAPLAAVSGLAGLLVDDPDLDKDSRQRVALQIRDTARRILDLFNDLVDLERIDHRDLVVRRERVDALALIQELIDQIDLGARAVVVDAPTEPIIVDPLLVGRIVENLLRNVTHHTPDGTDVWVQVRREPDGYVLVVEDSGPGVDPALAESLFEPLQRTRRAGREVGLGVGLTLVKRFAELQGGHVRAEPRIGGGASFHVLLPLAEAE